MHSRFVGFEMGAGMSTSQSAMPDFGVPSPARMYDYYLGGKDHFAADREAAERVIAAYPQARTLALANRRFLERAVKFLSGQGIRQFIDLGTGLPTSPNVHEVAQGIRQDARVAYVDNDPVVTVHGRALCGKDDGVTVIDGDIRQPEAVFTNPELIDRIDLSQPVALLCVAVLHFITEDEEPRKIVTALQRQMAPGSYLVISHMATDGADKSTIDEITDAYMEATSPAVPRTESAIRDLFTGLDLAEPGLTDVARWRCTSPAETGQIRVLGGVGRKRPSTARLPVPPPPMRRVQQRAGRSGEMRAVPRDELPEPALSSASTMAAEVIGGRRLPAAIRTEQKRSREILPGTEGGCNAARRAAEWQPRFPRGTG